MVSATRRGQLHDYPSKYHMNNSTNKTTQYRQLQIYCCVPHLEATSDLHVNRCVLSFAVFFFIAVSNTSIAAGFRLTGVSIKIFRATKNENTSITPFDLASKLYQYQIYTTRVRTVLVPKLCATDMPKLTPTCVVPTMVGCSQGETASNQHTHGYELVTLRTRRNFHTQYRQ